MKTLPSLHLLVSVVTLLALSAAWPQAALAQQTAGPGTSTSPGAPQNLRVDVANGTQGELLVTWDAPTGGGSSLTYNVFRATSQSGSYSLVSYCSAGGGFPRYDISPPSGGTIHFICRDDNGHLMGNTSTLTVGTTYWYEVQACSGTNGTGCGPFNSAASNNTNSFWSNTPVSCNCSLTNMQGFLDPTSQLYSFETPKTYKVLTSSVIPSTLYYWPYPCVIVPGVACTEVVYQKYSYWNPNAVNGYQGKVVIALPGSGSLCGLNNLAWTAQNLGYDVLCVNYDNNTEQETICAPGQFAPGSGTTVMQQVANCFSAISQAKLNWTPFTISGNTIDCTSAGNLACGGDATQNVAQGKTGNYYYVNSQFDAVIPRITLMLYWLYCNAENSGDKNNYSTHWENYLSLTGTAQSCQNKQTAAVLANYAPNWSTIVLSGWSQGGVMSTFASYEYPIYRVINQSAPPDADTVPINSHNATADMIPASFYTYLNSGRPINGIGTIYGLISANDSTRYCVKSTVEISKGGNGLGVYGAVWNALRFVAANGDPEQDFNWNSLDPPPCTGGGLSGNPSAPPNPVPSLSCPATSHSFVLWSPPYKSGTGHDDTLEIWNEDFYQFMLTQ
jgi:hypothetical protein